MTQLDQLLSRLDGLRQTGHGRWIACCPAHDDKHPSLSIRLTDDDVVLLHCHAGCDTSEVLAALGMEMSDLFPARPDQPFRRGERRPFPAEDVLNCIVFEVLVVALAGEAILNADPAFTEADRERMWMAIARIRSACDTTRRRR